MWFRGSLADDRIEAVVQAVIAEAEKDDWDSSWNAAHPLRRVLRDQPRAALAMARLLARGAFDRQRGLELAAALFDAHQGDIAIVGRVADAFESLHDIRFLNDGPPSQPFLRDIVRQLQGLLERPDRDEQRAMALEGLACAARILGRSWDTVAERAWQNRIALDPERWESHYGIGLFYKTRGRFAEGQAANQRAFDLGGSNRENVLWNLGICATGARDGTTALRIWKSIGQTIEMGRFGLPEGGYPSAKVRLAERPIATRDPSRQPDDPGREESIWVERLSPCHGIVRSALYYDEIGVDYGDVVMFDGAPITFHTYGETKTAVYPHLFTLERPGYQIFRFAGTQQREKEICDLSEDLPDDSVLYVHDEQFSAVCAACWADETVDHADHRTEQHIVTGKLCAPPSIAPHALLGALDHLLERSPEVRLFVPDLADLAGDPARASVERRRMAMIKGNPT